MNFITLIKSLVYILILHIFISCSFVQSPIPVKKIDPFREVRHNFNGQVELLSVDLNHSSLVSNSKQSKKIVESFLNKDDLQTELDLPFQMGFEKVNDYYKRTQFWIEQFDRKLNLAKQFASENPDRLDINFLESSHEYNILQLMRTQQEDNLDQIINEYEFFMQTYNGLIADSEVADLEEKLKRSVVAAKFLLRLNTLEQTWRDEYPLVYEKIHEHLVELNLEVGSEVSKYKKLAEGKKFIKAKDRVLSGVFDVDYDSDAPTQDMTIREIDLFQKNSALLGEKIYELTNKDEILLLESKGTRFFGEFFNLNVSQQETLIRTNKCIMPALGREGNLGGGELPKDNWVLTLDDGPSSKYTEDFLKYLGEDGIKASFFMLAKKMESYKKIVKVAHNEGHIIASHSWSHANLPKLLEAELDHEIVEPNLVHQSILNNRPKFFRCPYGAGYKELAIRQRIVEQGMIHVLWNVDTLDWQDKNPESIVQRTMEQMLVQKRGIILFHDIHVQSLEASRELLAQVKVNSEINWLSIQGAVELINKNRGCNENEIH